MGGRAMNNRTKKFIVGSAIVAVVVMCGIAMVTFRPALYEGMRVEDALKALNRAGARDAEWATSLPQSPYGGYMDVHNYILSDGRLVLFLSDDHPDVDYRIISQLELYASAYAYYQKKSKSPQVDRVNLWWWW
jgi:hypothetical protein